MADSITYQEVASTIAAILTRHPQFEKLFNKFERLPWLPVPRGLMKKTDSGGMMVAEKCTATGRLEIVFMSSGELDR